MARAKSHLCFPSEMGKQSGLAQGMTQVFDIKGSGEGPLETTASWSPNAKRNDRQRKGDSGPPKSSALALFDRPRLGIS